MFARVTPTRVSVPNKTKKSVDLVQYKRSGVGALILEEVKQLKPRIAHLSQTNDFTFGKLCPNCSARTVGLRCSKRFAVLGTVASGVA